MEQSLISEIKTRCNEKKISFEIIDEEAKNIFKLYLPNGQNTREVIFRNSSLLKRLSAIEFENYRFIPGFEGIWNESKKEIQCIVKLKETIFKPILILGILDLLSDGRDTIEEADLDKLFDEQDREINITLTNEYKHPNLFITISQLKEELAVLCKTNFFSDKKIKSPNLFSITISGVDCKTSLEAEKLIIKFAYPILFQLHSLFNIPLIIERENTQNSQEPHFHKDDTSLRKLVFPETHYDQIPSDLFFSAINSTENLTIQYLNFYQILEHFFPIFSNEFALNNLKGIVSNPTFNKNNEKDLLELYDKIRTKIGYYERDEKNSLKLVIEKTIEVDKIKKMISANAEISKFFKENKDISQYSLNNKLSDSEFITAISQRIYEIRCKIVHSKQNYNSNEPNSFIYAKSKTETLLFYDTKLLEEISKRVIFIKSSDQ